MALRANWYRSDGGIDLRPPRVLFAGNALEIGQPSRDTLPSMGRRTGTLHVVDSRLAIDASPRTKITGLVVPVATIEPQSTPAPSRGANAPEAVANSTATMNFMRLLPTDIPDAEFQEVLGFVRRMPADVQRILLVAAERIVKEFEDARVELRRTLFDADDPPLTLHVTTDLGFDDFWARRERVMERWWYNQPEEAHRLLLISFD